LWELDKLAWHVLIPFFSRSVIPTNIHEILAGVIFFLAEHCLRDLSDGYARRQTSRRNDGLAAWAGVYSELLCGQCEHRFVNKPHKISIKKITLWF
jgi:hypothetical protein